MRHVEARVENGLAKREGSSESWENIAMGKYMFFFFSDIFFSDCFVP